MQKVHVGRVQFCESGRLTEYLCHICSGPEGNVEGKYFGIVCKYSTRYNVSCRKFFLNNCFNQIPWNFGPNPGWGQSVQSGNHVVASLA